MVAVNGDTQHHAASDEFLQSILLILRFLLDLSSSIIGESEISGDLILSGQSWDSVQDGGQVSVVGVRLC